MATSNNNTLTDKLAAAGAAHFDLSNMKDDFNEKQMLSEAKITDAFLNTINKATGVVNVVEYHRILDTILKSDSTTNELNCNKIQEITDTMKVLQEKDLLKFLPTNGLTFKEIIKEYDEVQSRILELKSKELPEIVDTIKAFQLIGLFCPQELLEQAMEIGSQCVFISSEREKIIEHVGGLKYCADGLIGMANIACGKDLLKSDKRKLPSKNRKKKASMKKDNPEKADNEFKGNILLCRSEHNIPFCEICGWRSEWLETFRKRGVYIKEADNYTSKNSCVNNAKSD